MFVKCIVQLDMCLLIVCFVVDYMYFDALFNSMHLLLVFDVKFDALLVFHWCLHACP